MITAFAGMFGRASFPDRVRAAEPAGFDAALWHDLLATGVLVMAVPEQQHGWGASMLDLGLVAEQAGRWIAPAPVIECQVAARLLAKVGSGVALETLTSVLAGTRLVSLSLHPVRSGVAALGACRRCLRRTGRAGGEPPAVGADAGGEATRRGQPGIGTPGRHRHRGWLRARRRCGGSRRLRVGVGRVVGAHRVGAGRNRCGGARERLSLCRRAPGLRRCHRRLSGRRAPFGRGCHAPGRCALARSEGGLGAGHR